MNKRFQLLPTSEGFCLVLTIHHPRGERNWYTASVALAEHLAMLAQQHPALWLTIVDTRIEWRTEPNGDV